MSAERSGAREALRRLGSVSRWTVRGLRGFHFSVPFRSTSLARLHSTAPVTPKPGTKVLVSPTGRRERTRRRFPQRPRSTPGCSSPGTAGRPGMLTSESVARALVPVSVRSADERQALTNRVSAGSGRSAQREPNPLRRHAAATSATGLHDRHQRPRTEPTKSLSRATAGDEGPNVLARRDLRVYPVRPADANLETSPPGEGDIDAQEGPRPRRELRWPDRRARRQARAGGDVDVTVISASDRFLFNPSLIWVPFGKRTEHDITFPLGRPSRRTGSSSCTRRPRRSRRSRGG